MVRTRARSGAGACVLALVLLPACSVGPSQPLAGPAGTVSVVAAEDFWGSIAKQLGGDYVTVRSIITNPDTDPHDYEPTPADTRAIAAAQLVITNGIGYDPWTDKLLRANPSTGRAVVRVGDVVGLEAGDNPHQWYSPESVEEVIAAITEGYRTLDPAHASLYDRLRTDFEASALGPYRSTIAAIRTRYAGTPIGASESLVAVLASALGLDLVTPPSFLNAISEGNDPSARDKAVVDDQIAAKAIKVFVFNSQNATPDVERLVDAARLRGIAVTAVTETLTPPGASFQVWQTTQLRALESALAAASA